MICEEPEMVLPHPEIANRLFVLQPLVEIGPELCHPVSQKTSVEMLQDFLEGQQGSSSGQQVLKTSWSGTDDEVSE